VTAVLAVLGGLFRINPLWLFGPYHPAVVSAASQPDWYVWFLDGALRLFPPWEVDIFDHSIAPIFWAGVLLPGILALLAMAYPFLEARFTGDRNSTTCWTARGTHPNAPPWARWPSPSMSC
jgi:ubiquinol-cytochrome c reductase cytochrome b subunit